MLTTTRERAEAAILQYGADATSADIQSVTGLPMRALREARRRLGIPSPACREIPPDQEAAALARLREGAAVRAVARDLGRSWSWVRRRAVLAGVLPPSRAVAPSRAVPSRAVRPALRESDPQALRPLPPPPDLSDLGLTAEDLRAGQALRGGGR